MNNDADFMKDSLQERTPVKKKESSFMAGRLPLKQKTEITHYFLFSLEQICEIIGSLFCNLSGICFLLTAVLIVVVILSKSVVMSGFFN